KNKPALVKKAREVFESIKKEIPEIIWDDNGNIGKRYRRQDEIGTPHCITVDFETLENDTVTVRDRDTGKQERTEIKKLADFMRIKNKE
ncbi:MAG: His/Gly/Thr/Pro-type tRNA ligase C-terminal domain-containing protein, partial [Patescibacteria group bacterium]